MKVALYIIEISLSLETITRAVSENRKRKEGMVDQLIMEMEMEMEMEMKRKWVNRADKVYLFGCDWTWIYGVPHVVGLRSSIVHPCGCPNAIPMYGPPNMYLGKTQYIVEIGKRTSYRDRKTLY